MRESADEVVKRVAFIVLGGTLGAVMVSTPWMNLKGAAFRLAHVLLDKTQPPDAIIEELEPERLLRPQESGGRKP